MKQEKLGSTSELTTSNSDKIEVDKDFNEYLEKKSEEEFLESRKDKYRKYEAVFNADVYNFLSDFRNDGNDYREALELIKVSLMSNPKEFNKIKERSYRQGGAMIRNGSAYAALESSNIDLSIFVALGRALNAPDRIRDKIRYFFQELERDIIDANSKENLINSNHE